jgi:hypothetical protein
MMPFAKNPILAKCLALVYSHNSQFSRLPNVRIVELPDSFP